MPHVSKNANFSEKALKMPGWQHWVSGWLSLSRLIWLSGWAPDKAGTLPFLTGGEEEEEEEEAAVSEVRGRASR